MDAPLKVPTKHETTGSFPHVTIGQEVENRLHRSGYLALRDISCDVRNGVIHLRDRVPLYYLKQIAQVIVLPQADRPGDRGQYRGYTLHD